MAWPFSKPDARIYVNEVRKDMDPLVVPIFTPDTAIDVGDFGSFEDGRFVRRGNLADRGVELDIEEGPRQGFEFASAGKVTISPSVTVPNPVGGGDLAQAKVTFGSSKAVVASFQDGVERSIKDADAFGETLAQLWASKQLRTDRAVVWSVRRATGGTVIVSRESDNELDITANAALLAPAGLTLGGMAVGVSFGTERKSTWKMSADNADLVVWARLFKLDPRKQEAVDGYKFEPGDPGFQGHVGSIEPVPFSPEDLIGQLEDGE